MKKLFLVIVSAFLLLACNKQSEADVDIEALKKEVRQNEHFIAACAAVKEIGFANLSGKVSMRNVDKNYVSSRLKGVKTPEDLKKLYDEAGMTGSAELVALQRQFSTNLILLVKDIPELKKLNKAQLKQVLNYHQPISKEEFAEKLNERLNKNTNLNTNK